MVNKKALADISLMNLCSKKKSHKSTRSRKGDSEVSARGIPFAEIDREAKITGLPAAEQGLQG